MRDFTATPSSVQTGDVPAMSLTFTLKNAVAGSSGGTLTLTVASTAPVPGLPVFANATPAEAGVVLVGLPNCTGATGAIDAVQQRLTITLPSGCVLAANVSLRAELPSGFFAPNPAVGTTVVLALSTSSDPEPRRDPGYTISMWRVPGGCRAWLAALTPSPAPREWGPGPPSPVPRCARWTVCRLTAHIPAPSPPPPPTHSSS